MVRWMKVYGWYFLHALVLTLLSFWWMSTTTWEFGAELTVERFAEWRYLLQPEQEDQLSLFKKKLLLINTSYDKTLIPYADLNGSGNTAITDRKKLGQLFHLMNEANGAPAYVVCDLFLDFPSTDDSLMFAEMKKLQRVIVSSFLNEDGTMNKPHSGLTYGLAQYETRSGTFLKYRLLHNDSTSYVPLLLFEKLNHQKLSPSVGLAVSSEGWWLNSFVVDLPIRSTHIQVGELVLWNLGEALQQFSAEEIKQELKDRLVIVGDFYGADIHDTTLGSQPGPLILVNAYWCIFQRYPRITVLLFVSLLTLYFFATLFVFRRSHQRVNFITRQVYQKRIIKKVFKYLTYIVVFAFFSFVVYWFTYRHLQLIVFALYFNVLDYGVSRYRVLKRMPSDSQK